MQHRGFRRWWVPLFGAAALLVGGCSGDDTSNGRGSLQSSCVLDQLGFARTLADAVACDNFGYSDCYGFASECINYCAHGFCQPNTCATAADCVTYFGERPAPEVWECSDYIVSGTSYGTWCEPVEGCPEGTLGCPCAAGGACGPDPFGTGDMICASGYCESACPSSCIVGSVCCGGSLCSGDCIGTPCC